MNEYEPELIPTNLDSLPDPLDKNIASLNVWTDVNDPTDGFDVLINTHVGSDIIDISVGDNPIQVLFEIYQGEVSLHFSNCVPSYGPDFELLFGHQASISESVLTQKTEMNSDASVKFGSNWNFDASTGRRSEATVQQKESGPRVNFRHHAFDGLLFGNWKRTETPLLGQIVPQYRGWRVKHADKSRASVIIAKFKVRENWIRLKEIEAKGSGRFSNVLNAIMQSKDSADRKKKELFEKLLELLILKRLQTRNENKSATIAVAGFIVRPQSNSVLQINNDRARTQINLPESLLYPILIAPAGGELSCFESATRAIDSAFMSEPDPFTPQTGYTDALETYLELAIDYRDTGGAFATEDIELRYGENIITDLRKLGVLVSDRKGKSYFMTEFPLADPVLVFQSTVGKQKTIEMAQKLMLAKPDASAMEVGEALRNMLGRKWAATSTKRYGNTLKQWALQRQADGRGQPAKISGAYERIVMKLRNEKRTANEIAALIGVSPETVRRLFRDPKA